MSCYITYKGKNYTQEDFLNFLKTQIPTSNIIKPGVKELFESNPELANSVYEALGFGKVKKEIKGINISTRSTERLGKRLTNPNWYAKDLMDVEAPYKANASKIKAPHLNADEALKYDMNLMYNLQVQKFRRNPELIDEINDAGGLEFIKNSSHIVGVKNSRWEGKGMESNFIKVLAKSYETVAKELNKFQESSTEVQNSEITPQQKQQAQQLYSQYLDSLNTIELHSKLGNKTESGNVTVVKNIFTNKDDKDVITAFRVDKKLGLLESFRKYNAIGNPINWQGFKPRFEGDNATIAFMDWFLGKDYTDLEQEYRQEILNNLDNLKGKTIEYYKELGRPSHATALDYLINQLGSKQDIEGFKNWVDEFNRGKYLQLASELVNPAIEELDKYLLDFLKKFNVKSKQFEELKSRLGVNALGATDVLNKLIWYVENRNEETLPEEAAHMLVALMGENHPEIKELLLNITNWEEYESIKNQYLPIYKDESKVKIEAIGKLIAKSLVKNYKANGLDNNKLKAALENIINFIKNILDSINVGDAFKYNTSIADKIAINVLSGNKDFIYKIKNTNPNLNAFEEIENNPNAKEIINKFSSNNVKMTGSLAIAGTENIRRPEGQGIHDVDFKVKSFDVFNKEVLPKIPENAVPAHYGWHKKTYSTFAYLIPSKGYRIEVIERKDGFSNGWVTNYKLFNEKNEQVEITQQNIMGVDFFVYKEGVHNKDFDFSSEFIPASLVYEGKMSLGGNSNPYFFSRDKDQEDYVLRNPKSFIPFEKHIYYQLEGFKNWKENQNNSTSFNPNINKTENTLDKLNIFVNPREICK